MKNEIDYGTAKDVVTKAVALATEATGCSDKDLQVFDDLHRYYEMTINVTKGFSDDEAAMLSRLRTRIANLGDYCHTRAMETYESLKYQIKTTKIFWDNAEHATCLQSLELQHNLESRLYKCLYVAENLTILRDEIRRFIRNLNEEGTNDDNTK